MTVVLGAMDNRCPHQGGPLAGGLGIRVQDPDLLDDAFREALAF